MIAASLAALALAAAAAPLLCRHAPRFGTLLLAAVPFALGCVYASQIGDAASGGVHTESWRWLPALGATIAFRLDGLALLFALLISFIGSFVLLYASSYLRDDPRLGSLSATLLAFMAAMLGVVVSDNIVLLFVSWELTSITSFLLIGFDTHRDAARRSAWQALLTTGVGGLVLLAGLVLLGLSAGSFELSSVIAARDTVQSHHLYDAVAVLVLIGAFTKSAITPFHYWLPNAMEAPTPVSALLHSATMVKAGVYLIARLHPALGGTPLWDDTLVIFGGITMLTGAALATRQNQLKRILAYSTVSSLGTLVMLIGLDAAKAAAIYLLAHAMYKGCLFLVAGSVTHATGRKDPEALGGLARAMPALTACAIVAGLSFAGMFPFLGFAGKELALKAGIGHSHWAAVATSAVVVAAVLTVFAAILVGFRPFFGARPDGIDNPHDPGWRQLFGPALLAIVGVVAGLAPSLFAEPIARSVIASIDGALPEGKLKLDVAHLLWPPTLAMGLSLAALTLGTVLFIVRRHYIRAVRPLAPLAAIGPNAGYFAALKGVLRAAAAHTRIVQSGSLQVYVRVTAIATVTAGALALARTITLPDLATLAGVPVADAIIITVLIAAAIAATAQRTALASVASLGGVGFTVVVVFALYGAPDVAMTQFAVETLVVIIFVLVIFHLPRYRRLSQKWLLTTDTVIASAFGALMTLLALRVGEAPPPESISAYYAQNSVTEAFGRNVINVILVDFRALDTLGEVFVIGVAAIGVYTLLRLRAGARSSQEPGA